MGHSENKKPLQNKPPQILWEPDPDQNVLVQVTCMMEDFVIKLTLLVIAPLEHKASKHWKKKYTA